MDSAPKIYFIGYMASGKSRWAKKLARRWNMLFIDLDKEIESRAGVSITTLFRDHGEDYFRKLENALLKELSEVSSGYIMATGGGTPCFMDNMEIIQQGFSVYLKVKKETLLGRLRREKQQRPLIAHLNDDELRSFIDRSLDEREKVYGKAALIIEEPGLNITLLENSLRDQLR